MRSSHNQSVNRKPVSLPLHRFRLPLRYVHTAKLGLSTISERRQFWERIITGQAGERAMRGDASAAGRAFDSDLSAHLSSAGSAAGCVTLVGAGPGDPELLTLKGLRAVQGADVIPRCPGGGCAPRVSGNSHRAWPTT